MIWIFRLVAVFVAVVFTVTGFMYLIRFYETQAADATRGVFRPLDRQRLVAALGAWSRESGCNMAMALLFPMGILPRPKLRDGSWLPVKGEVRHGRPVLLVPGYGMNRGSLSLLAWRLEKSRRPTLAMEFPSGLAIERAAEKLGEAVAELKAATHADKVDLVCHSRGGVVAHWWVGRLGGDAHVERVITLGTPFGGTKAAAFGVGPSVLQMFPGSELLRTLAGTPLNPAVTFYAVNGDADAMLLPPGADQIPPPGRNVRLSGVGHTGLLLSARVWAQVFTALRRMTEDEMAVTGFADETEEEAADRAIAQLGR